MNKKNNQVPALTQPMLEDNFRSIWHEHGGSGDLPVAVAGNKEMSPQVTISLLVAFGIASLIIAAVTLIVILQWASWRWSSAFALLSFFIVFTVLIRTFFPAISGDAAALRESDNRKKRADKETENRLEAFGKLVDYYSEEGERQKEVELARIRQGNLLADLQEQQALMEDRINRMLMGEDPPTIVPHRNNRISTNTDNLEAYQAILAYLNRVYDNGDEELHTTGHLKKKVPWNAEWSGKSWRTYAKNKLTSGEFSPLTWEGQGYKLRYESKHDAMRVVERL